ncbi:hypothetical protein LBMAG42_07740 [Deltaproteobacteria bacterium]|nr:hypothetical protein LBMAG42_07740 [Deltaproteobacteria bacterium]
MPDYNELISEARAASTPDEAAVARVAADVRRRSAQRAATRWILPAAGVGLSLAAAAFFFLRPPVEVSAELGAAAPAALGANVRVTAAGEGAVVGTEQAMVVSWRRGTLSVEVEPNQGVSLQVKTDEADVWVVGTGFDVDRGPLGTTVSVRHGRVRVVCARGGESFLEAGASRVCLPTTSAGVLRRVLSVQGTASPTVLLDEVDSALALDDVDGVVAAELLALRVETLVASGRGAEAAAAAETALAHPSVTRAEELHRMAAHLRLEAGDCEGARPHVEALTALGRLGDEAVAWEACAGGR